MKYIRTEKGIYEVVGADSCSYLNAPPEMYYITSCNKNILKSKVIAQADTIEELCDEFVLFDKQFNTHGLFDKKVITYEWLKSHIEIYQEKYFTIYGAIWTDKGLIYVAKMNEKGELELL
jgi:hypothetical protein